MIKKIITAIILITFTCTNSPVLCAQPTKKVYKKTIPQTKTIKAGVVKNVKYTQPPKNEFIIPQITDETAQELAKRFDKSELKKQPYKEVFINDEPIIISAENKKQKRKKYNGKVNTEPGLEVVLKPLCRITTKNSNLKIKQTKGYKKQKIALPAIGEKIAFKVVKDVKKEDKVLIKKDSTVFAKVGIVSPRAMGGAPAEMILEDFEILNENGETKPLEGKITSSGYSLAFWIGLAELATTPFLFGLAVPLLRVLPGGQAKISPNKKYVVYYQN